MSKRNISWVLQVKSNWSLTTFWSWLSAIVKLYFCQTNSISTWVICSQWYFIIELEPSSKTEMMRAASCWKPFQSDSTIAQIITQIFTIVPSTSDTNTSELHRISRIIIYSFQAEESSTSSIKNLVRCDLFGSPRIDIFSRHYSSLMFG